MEEKCRACLSPNDLFLWNAIIGDEMTYADLFFQITQTKNDFQEINLICDECGALLREIFMFIQKAKAAKKVLSTEAFGSSKRFQVKHSIIEIGPTTESEICIETTTPKCEWTDDSSLGSLEETEEAEFINSTDEKEIKFEAVDVSVTNDRPDSPDLLSEPKDDAEWIPKNKTRPTANASHKCEHCGKCFQSASNLKRHFCHRNGNKFLCDACPRTFLHARTLRNHRKTHAEHRSRDYACNLCDNTFLSSEALRGHMDIHNAKREKRFQCDQCDKAFFQRGALNVHRRIHTGQLVTCDICDKRYPRAVDLEMHMRTHTGERPFKCSTCGKSFKYSSTLYTHVRSAHLGFIYKCGFCSMQYKEKQALLDHKVVHKTSKYKCCLCDKEMMKKYRLKHHIQKMHAIDNPDDLEELIVSNKSGRKHRTMRKFTNIEYKDYIDKMDQSQILPAIETKGKRSNRKQLKSS